MGWCITFFSRILPGGLFFFIVICYRTRLASQPWQFVGWFVLYKTQSWLLTGTTMGTQFLDWHWERVTCLSDSPSGLCCLVSPIRKNYISSLFVLVKNIENKLFVLEKSCDVHLFFRYERLFGRFAHSNICVTNAMRKDLKEKWGIRFVLVAEKLSMLPARNTRRSTNQYFVRSCVHATSQVLCVH